KLDCGIGLHSQSNPMQHKPCGLLSDTQRTMNLPTANAIFAVGDHPHYRQPLLQAERGILEDRPCLEAELCLRMACLALPETARRNKGNVLTSARWARDAIWPAPDNEKVHAVVSVGE